MAIQTADLGEGAEIASILDAAYLQVDTDDLRGAVERGDVLVAVADGSKKSGPILGVTVCDGREITAIAVRPGRRGQGIGTELVAAVESRQGRVVAEFDPTVRPFWESVGFEVTERPESERLRGVRE